MSENTQKEMTDGEMLEMSNHLKSLYDAKDKEVVNLKIENLKFKKVIMSIYGTIRLIDLNSNSIFFEQSHINILIEMLRSFLSEVVEYDILKIDFDES